jgi:hypothetical protein
MPASTTGWGGIDRRCFRTGWRPARKLASNIALHGSDGRRTRTGPWPFRMPAIVAVGSMLSVEIIRDSGSSIDNRS